MSKTSTVGRRIAGGVVGLLAGGVAGVALGWLLLFLRGPGSGDQEEGLMLFISYVGLGLIAGTIVGATAGAVIASPEAEPASSFVRQGDDTHCKKCGSELIGPGGPCRKCDDVKTRPCSSCGRYILTNDKTCPYCGADLK